PAMPDAAGGAWRAHEPPLSVAGPAHMWVGRRGSRGQRKLIRLEGGPGPSPRPGTGVWAVHAPGQTLTGERHGVSEGYDLVVNGEPVHVDGDGTRPLLAVLRDELGLRGSRFGCGTEECGACMVLIDGEPSFSCTRTIESLAGKAVTTVEGLSSGDVLSPLQQAFLDEQAGQCGYCLSGILISATALLARNPKPSRSEIAAAPDRHLCRCGAHNRIMRAVARAGTTTGRSVTGLPKSLIDNPLLATWVGFEEPGCVRLATGKVEIGQGVLTALAQIAAEELDVAPERLRLVSGETSRSPAEGFTSGSNSIAVGGAAVRLAGAQGRTLFVGHVAQRLGCSPDEITVTDGRFLRAGRDTGLDYWSLAADVDLARPATGHAPVKNASAYQVVGRSLPRLDLPAKVKGDAFIHDIAPPDV